MYYVYIIQSELDSNRYYTGFTKNVERRIADHNSGKNKSTTSHRPWRLKSYVAFTNKERAYAFEKYLKTGSGRALATKHL